MSAIRCSTGVRKTNGRRTSRRDATAAPDEPSVRGEAWNEGEGPPNGHAIDERLDISADDVFPDDAAPSRPRTSDVPAGYSEWAAVGTGGRDDGDYNLEKFVSAETTLSPQDCAFASSLRLPVSDPARRDPWLLSHRSRRRGRYLGGDLAAVAEKLGTTITEVETVLGIVQGFDPPGIAAPATSRNAWRCSSRSATASIRRWRP